MIGKRLTKIDHIFRWTIFYATIDEFWTKCNRPVPALSRLRQLCQEAGLLWNKPLSEQGRSVRFARRGIKKIRTLKEFCFPSKLILCNIYP